MSRNGFTILELLAVVFIMGLMMALGVYWLSAARYSGKLVVSQRNLKAIGQMIAEYANDHKGSLPRPHNDGLASDSNHYGADVFSSPTPETTQYIGDKLFPRYCSDPTLFFCPLSTYIFPADLWKKNGEGIYQMPKNLFWSYTYLGQRGEGHIDVDVANGKVLVETCSPFGTYKRTGEGQFDRETIVLYSDFSVQIEDKFKW